MGQAARTPRGRHFFANPGPTNIPDSILHAVAHPSVDFNDAGFFAVYEHCVAGLKRILKTQDEIFLYTGSGHAAWEASLVNLLSPGDRVLIIETGHFSDSWARMVADLGLVADTIAADWRRGVDFAAVQQRSHDGCMASGGRVMQHGHLRVVGLLHVAIVAVHCYVGHDALHVAANHRRGPHTHVIA
jgi:hypothetical protein